LRDKRIEDAEQDYIWRSDHELASLDAAFPLTMSYDRFLKLAEDQMRYPTPGSHHFATETLDGKFIGNCMYYDLDSVKMQAELGIVIGDRDYWSNSYGYDAVTTLLDHCFNEKKLERVYLHTLEWNKRAQRCFEKCGFVQVRPVRRMSHDFILMEVFREDWFAKAEERLAARFINRKENTGPQAVAPE
jgi:RimJ/RimL family protein N-acetyltransferase